MQRLLLAAALAVALCAGCTAVARADDSHAPGSHPPPRPTTPPLYTTPGGFTYYNAQPIRWQIIVLPSPTRGESVAILLDTLTGASYILRLDGRTAAGYAWEKLSLR